MMSGWMAGVVRVGLMAGLLASAGVPCVAVNRVTILNDAFGRRADLEQDWGYSALIEFEGRRILFDTGDNAALFQKNVEKLHVDLSRLDMVIVTHAHGDHTSGLRYVLSKNPRVPLYVPDDPTFTGTTLPPGFLTTDARPELPAEMRYFGGGPRPEPRGWMAWTDTSMTPVRGPMTIAPHIRVVSLVSEKPAFKGLREISLVLDTPKGPVVFAGCSHPGIEGIMAAATMNDPEKPVYALFGGLHLLQDSEAQIDGTLGVLGDTYHVQRMAVGHCTGELAFLKIQQRWKRNMSYAGLGETIEF
jgi:7,8-dihydropterin-6-yl-methyl-4-(beta-D-ribofuranosyl)aminobenzene 5'-phosphate synthase